MSVAPRELLASAEEIRKTQSDEAGHRATISRAYYAAYHAAYAFHVSLPSPGSVGKATGRHEQFVSQLTTPTFSPANPRNLLSRRVGTILRDVARARVVADYSIGANLGVADADAAILKSREILKACTGA